MPNLIRLPFTCALASLAMATALASWSVPAAAMSGCTLTSFDSVVDFGTMRPPARGGDSRIKPSPQRRTFAAVCPAATRMSLVFEGEPKGAAEMRFGAGGAYTVRVMNARLDGAPVQLAHLSGVGQMPVTESSGELDLLPSDVFAPAAGRQPLSGKRLFVTLEFSPVIPVDAVRISETVKLDATAHLRLATP